MQSPSQRETMVTAVRGTSTAELVAQRLRDAIEAGTLAAGDQLHQEHLAARFGVSRSPVREALRLLEAQGVVTYYPNRGAIVTHVDRSRVAEVFEIRRLLEPAFIGHAAAAARAADVATLRLMHAQVEAERDAAAWVHVHRAFHDRVYALTGRPHMAEILMDHRLRISEMADMESIVRGVRRALARCDRALIAALAGGDVAAAGRATLDHLAVLEQRALGARAGS